MAFYLILGLLCIVSVFSLIFGVYEATQKRTNWTLLSVGIIATIILIGLSIWIYNNPLTNI